ncbi:MAG: Imidazolonepropionase [Acidimicrobiaceae bacterium]|nr:Imidazolonepropionase [Acidimicrobiaceae bacterium]
MVTTVVRADRLIDGNGGAAIDRAVVVYEGSTIQGIHQDELPAELESADVEVLDYTGCTLLPGLIDAHVHLNLPGTGGILEDAVGESDGVLVAASANAALTALEAGITTVRDTGARRSTSFDLRRAISLGYGRGPRMLLVGQPVTITGGHTWYLGGEADGVEGVRKKVRELCKLGADWIKVMGSGGGTLNTISHRPAFRPQELEAIVDEAHRLDRRVTVHTLCAQALDDAIAVGVDQIEHASFLVDNKQTQEFSPAVADRLAKAGIPVTTTLAVAYDVVTKMSALGELSASDQQTLDRWKGMLADNLSQFSQLREIGVNFVAGTDAGWRFTRFDSLPDELRLMSDGGMSRAEAIYSATGKSADVLGIAGVAGRVRAGLQADLLAVEGNPLEDLAALKEVRLVVQGGEVRVDAGRVPRAGSATRRSGS